MAISKTQAEQLRAYLLREREKLMGCLNPESNEQGARMDIERYSDENERASAYEAAGISISVTGNRRETLLAIDRLLARLGRGWDGECSCGAEIPIKRLLTAAGTDKCVECVSKSSVSSKGFNPWDKKPMRHRHRLA